MAEMKMVLLTFVSKVNCKQFVIRIGVITKKRKKKFTKKMLSESFSDDLVIGGAATPSLKLERNSVVHVQIVGNLHPTKSSKDKDQYLLPVQKSGVWRDFVVLPAVADDRKLTELIFRRDSRSGTMLHTIFLDLNGNQQEEVSSAVSPGKRSLRVHDVDVGTQTELHVAYSEATYLLKPPGDSLKRNLPVKLRREVAKVSPSPSGSFSIRLDDVDEEADNASPRSDDQDDTVRDHKKEACEKLLSKQRLLKLVQELAPAEAFNLIVGLEVPEVKKKQEEHQEKNVVAVYFNLLVYWLEKMMGNKKKEAFDKLFLELKDVRQDLAESFQKDLDEYCQVSACANV